jgi:hypothetical protein
MDLQNISEETIGSVKKALSTTGWTSGLGVVGYDLGPVVSLLPKFTPLRDQLPRVNSTEGAKFTVWRTLLNVLNSQPSIFPGYDTAGNMVVVDEIDSFSNYVPIELKGMITQDSIDIAKDYADAHALMVAQVLTNLLNLEDRALGTGAQNFALPAIGTVVVSAGTAAHGISGSTTAGSIGSSASVNVRCAPISGWNYYNGGSGPASANATLTTGSTSSTNAVGAFVPAVKGAVGYIWFVGSSSSNQVYFTTTTTNTVLITSVPSTAQALPTYEVPDLYPVVPTLSTVDTSYSTLVFNSMLATILGDYGPSGVVTPGQGTGSGATWVSADGATLSVNGSSVALFDQLNLSIYNAIKQSPTAYMMNAQQASDLGGGLLASPAATLYLQPNGDGRSNIFASGFIGTYLNKALSGASIRIEVHPSVPPGTIIARSDVLTNVPGSDVGNVFEVRTHRDYAEFPYAATDMPSSGPSGPREIWGIRSLETLVNRAPLSCGVISNIAASE